jgi:predicted dinucleotide-binding enzyme
VRYGLIPGDGDGHNVLAHEHFPFGPLAEIHRQSNYRKEREAFTMKIGVIGIGEMGGTLARGWRAKGHTVRVANSRGPAAAKSFADEIGAEAVDIYGAVEDADVVLMAMAFPVAPTLPTDLFSRVTNDLAIIDTSNYYPDVRDSRILEIDEGLPESVWISRQLGRPIFKAFNSIMYYALANFGRPIGAADRIAIPVSGDNADGKSLVMTLINDMGFDPVDGGSLEESWRQQPSTPAYCCDYDAETTLKGIRAAVRGRAEVIRDTLWREQYGQLFASGPAYADVHPAVISMNRSFNPL